MLKQRVITAVALAIFFLSSLFGLSNSAFSIVIAVVVAVAAWEWANLASLIKQWQRLAYAGAILLTNFLCAWQLNLFATGSMDQEITRNLLIVACTWWAVALLWVQGYPASAVLWGRQPIKILMGFLVLVPGWLSISYLHTLPYGHWLIVLMILTVALADIGAYFSGRAFGKRKLAPEVSPGKSWEGVWGGLVCNLVLASLVAVFSEGGWLVLAVIGPASVVSVLGDLVESMVKRERGVKDSSQLLPGHGGVLDRIDGITAAAPVFALSVLMTGWGF